MKLWPWLLGGAVIVAGVAVAATSSSPEPDPEPEPDPDPDPTPEPVVDPVKPPKPTPDPRDPKIPWPPIAVGDPEPWWPLASSPRQVTDDLGNCRDACKRHHAGEDLPAPQGTMILAPEAGVVVTVRPEWYRGSGLLMIQGDSGLVVNLGEIEPNSEKEFAVTKGLRVLKGQPVARVGRHDQLHFETYVNGTTENSRWVFGEPPPPSLLDPVPYLNLAALGPREALS